MSNMRVVPPPAVVEYDRWRDEELPVLRAFAAVADAFGTGHEGPGSRDLAFGVMGYADLWEVGLGSPTETVTEVGEPLWYVHLDNGSDVSARPFPMDEAVAAFHCAVNALLHGVLEP